MGLLGTLLDKSKECDVSFTVKGDLNAVREFIIKRCTEKGYEICPKEDAWLGTFEAKRGRVEKNTISNSSFEYTKSHGNNDAATFYEFVGYNSTNGLVEVNISCRTNHAKSWIKTVQNSIINKFKQM